MKNERGLPMALDYFLCPGEVREIYGEKPIKLDIRFALNHSEDIFPQYWKLYGQSSGLKAYSDGVKLWTKGEKPGVWIESLAPSKEELEKTGFRALGTLSFILPKVSYAGIYQIMTRSFHSIVKLNSSIDYIKVLFGRIDNIPLQLELEPQEAHITINGKPAKKTIYTMKLGFDINQITNFLKKKQEIIEQLNNTPITQISVPQQEENIDEEEENEFQEELEKMADNIPL